MELFHSIPHIDFMGMRRKTATFSVIMFIVAIGIIYFKGLNFGLDFTGGTLIEVHYEQNKEPDDVRELLEEKGFDAKVTHFGTAKDILIRLANQEGVTEQELGEKVVEVLNTQNQAFSLSRVEFVGSEVGENLTEKGGMAILVAILATMIYIAMRFEYRFAISAAVALMHDPILILGIFAGFQIEFDLATLAAILAVIGYSLNDTIVVYDRVRENFRKVRKGSAEEVMNLSINETLSRTIMTSVLTLLVVVALFVFGGETLHGFSAALIIGIVIGTYSSIYIAGALALSMGLSRADLMGGTARREVDQLP